MSEKKSVFTHFKKRVKQNSFYRVSRNALLFNMDFSKIKIIIWDLDDTFWKGTLSEGEVEPIEKNIEFIKKVNRHGIVNTICSKNAKDITIQKLKDWDIADFFVFPSIDWTPKGERIIRLLKTMGLRPDNALFIDDNIQNLNEAKHFSEALMVAEPSVINELISYYSALPETDEKMKRLDQYKILEKKEEAKEVYSSNTDFLYSCNLHVEIREDCMEQIDRIVELVHRSNQLNFTKVRSSKEELTNLIAKDNIRSGWVTVKDDYGDYGMVGFYAVNTTKNECVHLLFSCRAIGMGIEQYVYAKLGYPNLTINGEVVAMVNRDPAPAWINQKNVKAVCPSKEKKDVKVLFKGPCDLLGLTNFIQGHCLIDEEFTYIGTKNNVIETHNHSVSLVSLRQYSEVEKKTLIDENVFMDIDYYKSNLYSNKYKIIFLSSLMEPNIGIYRKKGTDLLVPFAQAKHPLTDEKEWDGYIKAKVYNGQNTFNKEILERFSANYEFMGISTPELYISRLQYILDNTDIETKICIVLGSETPYINNKKDAYIDRHIAHKEFNDVIREFARNNERVLLLDVNKYVRNQSDFDGNINHFSVRVYYALAQEVIEMINSICKIQISPTSKWKMIPIFLNAKVKRFGRIVVPRQGPVFRFFQYIYRKIKFK